MGPVILAGMHRSGTSLVTRLLDDAGLFIGREVENNHEAVLFLGLNQWVLRNAGATWDDPEPIRYLLAHEGRDAILDHLRRAIGGRRARSFARGGIPPKGPWGWKDPRNTATLPLWLELFPDAKVLIVDRHGVDVARSLQARFEKTWPIRLARYQKYAPTYGWRASKHPVTTGFRVSDLEGAFATWQAYMGLADQHTKGLGDRLMRFHYEDLLTDPGHWLSKVFVFAGVEVGETAQAEIAGRIDASRAFAYRQDPMLADFARTKKEALAQYGYKP